MSAFEQWLAEQAQARESAGLTRHTAPSDTSALLDLAGNDYLGLAQHPQVCAAAVAATTQYGVGARASRLVSGTLTIHQKLEQALSELTGAASALVLSTGYHANLSAISALADSDTLLVCDAHIHASLIDACRLTKAARVVVPHNDLDAVRHALRERSQTRAIVVVESIYSVLGDAAALVELAALCSEFDALLLIDEAHGFGVAGDRGEGLAASLGLAGRSDVVLTGTLSKSIGSQGGVVLGSAAVRQQLVNRARPFIYDTGLAPAAVGGARAALGLFTAERIARVNAHAAFLAEVSGVKPPAGAVLSIPMPGPREALAAVAQAAEAGLRIGCFRPPSTPDGISRLRLTAHAHHTDADWERAAQVLRKVVP